MPEIQISPPEPIIGLPPFSCLCSSVGRAASVALSGELDIRTVPELDWVLSRAQTAAEMVVVDLRELEFIDSSGVQLLLAAHRRALRNGGRMMVIRGSAEIEWYFALIGLNRQLEFVAAPPVEASAPVLVEAPLAI